MKHKNKKPVLVTYEASAWASLIHSFLSHISCISVPQVPSSGGG